MFLPNEQKELLDQVANDPELLAYQAIVRYETKQQSWFRRMILDPVVKPLLAKLFREYLELAVRLAVSHLIRGGKL